MKMPNSRRLNRTLTASTALFFCTLLLAHAQGGDDKGLLYFPPKLTVKASSDPMWMYRIMGAMNSEDSAPDNTEFSGKISFTKTVEENTTLMLPMVFFDQGSNVIPERYQTFNGSADADNYVDSAEIDMKNSRRGVSYEIPKYYEVLNVIGYRMAYTDSVVIALEGGYSTEPGENAELAADRAQVIQEYLVNIWHIQPERIRLLPSRQMCDSSENIFKQEEARRVIIYSSNISLFRPVRYQTSDVSTNMIVFSIVIDPQMEAQDLTGMKLLMASGDEILSTTEISVSPDSTIYHLTGLWYLPRNLNDIEENLSVQLFVSTFDGKIRASNQVVLPIVITDQEETPPYGDEGEYGDGEYEGEEGEYSDEYSDEYSSDYSDGEEADWTEKDESAIYIGENDTSSYYPPESFEIEIPFFELSDTTLSSFQEMLFTQDMDSIRNELAKRSSIKWTITLYAEGEPGENPDVENGQLISHVAAYRSVTGFYEGLWKDRSFQTSLYFMPAFDRTRPESFDFSTFNQDFTKALFGSRAEEITKAGEEWSATYNRRWDSMSETTRAAIDTFLVHRAKGAVPPLLKALDTSTFSSIAIDTIVTMSRTYNGLDFKYSPEERFYERSVSIDLTSYNPYQEYDYNYDEEYDGEYDSTEYEEYDGEYDSTDYEEGDYQEMDEIESSEGEEGDGTDDNGEKHGKGINEESEERPS